jgi:hypothetical protein
MGAFLVALGAFGLLSVGLGLLIAEIRSGEKDSQV